MIEIGAFDAKTHLSSLLDKVARGEEVLITRRGQPVARLVPAAKAGQERSKAERRKRITAAQIAIFLDLLNRLPIVTDTETEDRAWREILTLARTRHLTTYDAAYLELATRNGALIQAARRIAIETLPACVQTLNIRPNIPRSIPPSFGKSPDVQHV